VYVSNMYLYTAFV